MKLNYKLLIFGLFLIILVVGFFYYNLPQETIEFIEVPVIKLDSILIP